MKAFVFIYKTVEHLDRKIKAISSQKDAHKSFLESLYVILNYKHPTFHVSNFPVLLIFFAFTSNHFTRFFLAFSLHRNLRCFCILHAPPRFSYSSFLFQLGFCTFSPLLFPLHSFTDIAVCFSPTCSASCTFRPFVLARSSNALPAYFSLSRPLLFHLCRTGDNLPLSRQPSPRLYNKTTMARRYHFVSRALRLHFLHFHPPRC